MQSTLLSEPNDAAWTQIAPLLDDAMSGLGETDRAALVLRFFENKTAREIADALKLNEAAAQKRVTRALEKLRELLAQRGIKTTAAALSVVITAHAVQAVPVGMAATITAAATVAGTTLVTTAIATATKTIAMTTLQKTIVAATVAVLVGVGIYEAKQATDARAEVQTLQQAQAQFAEQNQQLQKERDDAASRLAGMTEEIAKIKNNNLELLKLRGEVNRLRADASKANDSTQEAAKSWFNRVAQLKQRLEQMPEANIPELNLLNEEDWLGAVKERHLDTDGEYRRALSALRKAGESKVASQLKKGLTDYMKKNGKQFPSDLNQLQQYFDTPIDDAILQRWEIALAKQVPSLGMGGDYIITQKKAVDDVFDTRYGIGPDGFGTTDFLSRETRTVMNPVYEAFRNANNGYWPDNQSQLLPYVTTPEQQAALQKHILRESSAK